MKDINSQFNPRIIQYLKTNQVSEDGKKQLQYEKESAEKKEQPSDIINARDDRDVSFAAMESKAALIKQSGIIRRLNLNSIRQPEPGRVKLLYDNGELINGFHEVNGMTILYDNGKYFSGTYTDGKFYTHGALFTGTKNGIEYIDGVKQTTPAEPVDPVDPIDPVDPTDPTTLPTIDFPEIPEEKGSYENDTLILFNSKQNDDGTTLKVWSILNKDSSDTRTISQTVNSDNSIKETVVEDTKYDDDGLVTFSLVSTFGSTNQLSGREQYTMTANDTAITITTINDPDGTGLNNTTETREISMPTVTSADTVSYEKTACDTLLASLQDLPQTYYRYYTPTEVDSFALITNLSPWMDYEFPITYSILMEDDSIFELNDKGLISKVNIPYWTVEYTYNDKNQIESIKTTISKDISSNGDEIWGTVNVTFTRDENNKITSAEGNYNLKNETTDMDRTYIYLDGTYTCTFDENYKITDVDETVNMSNDSEFVIQTTTIRNNIVEKIIASGSDGNGSILDYKNGVFSDLSGTYSFPYDDEAPKLEYIPMETKIINENTNKKAVSLMSDEEIINELKEYYEYFYSRTFNIFDYEEVIYANDNIFYMYNLGQTDFAQLLNGKSSDDLEQMLIQARHRLGIVDTPVSDSGEPAVSKSDGKVGTTMPTDWTQEDNNTEPTENDYKNNINDNMDKLKDSKFHDNNSQSVDDALNDIERGTAGAGNFAKRINDAMDALLLRTDSMPDGKVDENWQQSTGDCWLLSSINARIDSNGGDISDIVHSDGNGGANITFKQCQIDINGKTSSDQDSRSIITINVTGEPINVTAEEINSTDYKGIALSRGDADVKAIEIAFYKLCEQNGIDPKSAANFQKPRTGYKLIFGNDIKEIGQSNTIEYPGAKFFAKIKQYIDENVVKKVLETVDLPNKPGTAATSFADYKTWKEWALYLDNSRRLLMENSNYTVNEIDVAIEKCKHIQVDNKNHYEFIILQDRDGNDVKLFGAHNYEYIGTDGKYVTLRNPHDNTATFEIPEIYFRLLFGNLHYKE